jgi:hypothetical protein
LKISNICDYLLPVSEKKKPTKHLMKGLFYAGGIILVWSAKALIWAVRNKKQKQVIVSATAMSVCIIYAGYYLLFADPS